jgi:hypothetical protein
MELALKIDPDDLALLRRSYPECMAQRGAYEMAYYEALHALPDETYVIQRVEEYRAGRLWVHHGRSTGH